MHIVRLLLFYSGADGVCEPLCVHSDASLLRGLPYPTGGHLVSHEMRSITAITPPTVFRESKTRIIQGFWGVAGGSPSFNPQERNKEPQKANATPTGQHPS